MKLMRYGPLGREQPGILDTQGNIRSLSGCVPDIGSTQISPLGLEALASIDLRSLPIVSDHPRIGVPVAGTRKLIGIGLNYADHAAESNLPVPSEPMVFTKAITCLQGPNDDVIIPRYSKKTDWEVELGIVIGITAQNIQQEAALEHVAGYIIGNDISEREFQLERGGTFDKGKGCDTVGPWLVTRDEVGNVQSLNMWLDVNGVRMQTGNTHTMIFSVAYIVSYLSNFMTLEPGDVITSGTPRGVGLGKKPTPTYLQEGDTMRLGIDKLGEQRQGVIAWRRDG
jgi:2-keto-4-pentenoate hydratase/2-oxohepta-3-ene-1,7-dioic acid hydratase in catechol pathway